MDSCTLNQIAEDSHLSKFQMLQNLRLLFNVQKWLMLGVHGKHISQFNGISFDNLSADQVRTFLQEIFAGGPSDRSHEGIALGERPTEEIQGHVSQ